MFLKPALAQTNEIMCCVSWICLPFASVLALRVPCSCFEFKFAFVSVADGFVFAALCLNRCSLTFGHVRIDAFEPDVDAFSHVVYQQLLTL